MRLILVAIILGFMNPSFSKEDCVSCGTGVRGLPSTPSEMEKLVEKLTMEDILSEKYCSIVKSTTSAEKFIANFRQMLINIHNDYNLAISENLQEQNIQLVKFLDKNFEHLRCTNDIGKDEKNYMSHIFDTQFYKFLFKDFLYKDLKNDAKITVNVNVIIEEDGIPKTPLDIVNEKIKNSNNEDIINELEITKKYITKGLGGVGFKDLPPEDVPDKYKELYARR